MVTRITRQGADIIVGCIRTSAPFVGLLNNGTEITGTNYMRIQYTGAFPFAEETADYYEYRNNTDIVFPVAGSNWGTVNQVGLWTSMTGGQLCYFSDLAVAKTVTVNDQIIIPVGYFVIRIPKVVT